MQLVGENIFSQLVLNVVAQSLWVFGIHGSSIIDTLRGPIMFGLDGAQQAAYAANLPLPNIMGMGIFLYVLYGYNVSCSCYCSLLLCKK